MKHFCLSNSYMLRAKELISLQDEYFLPGWGGIMKYYMWSTFYGALCGIRLKSCLANQVIMAPILTHPLRLTSTTTPHPYVSAGFQMDQPGQCINNNTLMWIIICENYEVQQQRCISIIGKWTYLNYWYDSLWFLEWYFCEVNIIEKC